MKIISSNFPTTTPLRITLPGISSVIGLAFWLLFSLNYLYLNRLLLVVTNNRFQLGILVLGLSIIVILIHQSLMRNISLPLAIVALIGLSLLSAWVNNVKLIQLLAFVRIPLTVYLIFDLVSRFITNKYRAEQVLRLMYGIAIFQLPIIILQRMAYPWLPSWFIKNNTLADFGMGTFTGDTSMAFALLGLVILLLFNNYVKGIIKRRWLIAGWLSLTILVSNSQIQHISIVLVWIVFLISHLRTKTFMVGSIILIFSISTLSLLYNTGVMTFPPIQNTIKKASTVVKAIEGNVEYDIFLSGGHARDAAIAYYLRQPIKWIGDGPGTVYDTASDERTLGGWGHIFTYYAEIGIIGLILSILVFFVIAFPIYLGRSWVKLRASWVNVLMFLAIIMVAIIKYPMGTSSLIFTYCLILICDKVINIRRTATETLPQQKKIKPTVSVG